MISSRWVVLLATLVAFQACAQRPVETEASTPRPSSSPTLLSGRKFGKLGPGTYVIEDFSSPLTITLDEEWEHARIPGIFVLRTVSMPAVPWLAIIEPTRVFRPVHDLLKDTNEFGQAKSMSVPAGLVQWLQEHPHLEVQNEERREIGGLEGIQLDVVVDSPVLPNVPLIAEPETVELPGKGAFVRLVVVDDGSQNLLFVVDPMAKTSGDDFLERADDVLENVEIRE